MPIRTKPRAVLVHARRAGARASALVRTEADLIASRQGHADVAVFHHYVPPPSGGGNQFMRALALELGRRDLTLEWNRISGETPTCLFNSFNFDFHRLRRFARRGARMVHRVDGPIGVYRGFDDGTDRRILRINRALADATVFQSNFSLEKHLELGVELRAPVVIPNAPDPDIFHPPASRSTLAGRPVRLVSTSWSDNPRKGRDVLAWLDDHLDDERYALTFVGRTTARTRRAEVVPPVASEALAEILRSGDIYVAASRDDPCSNAVLEALACGLPVAYLRSGGHPELVGDAGLGFDDPAELPGVLDRLANEIDERRAAIRVTPLAAVVDRYLEVLRR
jgi:glycosyltransferase involved in cell wall biosynthesis